MARRGGYSRDVAGIEWAKLGAGSDAEGKLSAVKIGQDYFTWLNDAVAHHVYRVEQMLCAAQYQADVKHAIDTNGITPQAYEAKYQVTREKPTITRTQPGQGSGPTSRNYRP